MKICSLNVKGLCSNEKRADVLHWLGKKTYDIFFLQETHCSKKLMSNWKVHWEGECFLSEYSAASRGVAILMRKNFDYEIRNIDIDKEGRYIFLDIIIDNKSMILCNIYAPNEDNPEFFKVIQNKITPHMAKSIILGGDWNFAMVPDIDTFNQKRVHNPKAREIVMQMKNNFNLEDIFRVTNPNERKYTWTAKNPLKMSRLDYFLISEELLNTSPVSDISFGYRSDHSLVHLTLNFSTNKKGQGYWKFNASLLHDPEYVEKVKNTIAITENDLKGNNHDNISDRVFWETLKMNIRGMTIGYSARKKKKQKNWENELTKQIELLEGETNPRKITERENKISELENMRKEVMQGVLLRSKSKWIGEGERNSKFFCSLEKRNFLNKTISFLNVGEDDFIKDEDILEKMKNFYFNLYSSKIKEDENCHLHEKFFPHDDVKLSRDEKMFCEKPLSMDEILTSLKRMKNEKSPGLDGFTPEFFKFFWKDLCVHMKEAFEEAFQCGEISFIQKEGLITCLPKPGKDRNFLKNWRPITLLNTDYKILSTTIANRFKEVLPSIISETQKGFLKGRFIGENSRLIVDVLTEAEQNKLPGLLLSVDFEKAFDSIEMKHLHNCLNHYNFGPNICKWIQTLYKDISSRVINNGHISEKFKLSRGVRQGDPLSPYLFILAVEPLATAIKRNKDIKGVRIGDVESILSQYADDIQFTLDGSETSLHETLTTLEQFGKISGLKMNTEKTRALWFGSKINCKMKLCTNWDLNWSQAPLKILGIIYTPQTQKIAKLNFDDAKLKIDKLLKNWAFRDLTLYGKITVIKTLALSKMNHLLSTLPIPDQGFMNSIEKLFFDFLWNGKKWTISRETLYLDHENGGLKMVDIHNFARSLRLSIIKRLITTKGTWQSIAKYILNDSVSYIFQLNKKSIQSIAKKITNPFWKQILKDWALIQDSPKQLVLWLNEEIKINKKTITYNSYIRENILYAEDLLNVNRTFLTYDELLKKYPGLRTNFIQYQGLLNCIPLNWKLNNIQVIQTKKSNSTLHIIEKLQKPNRYLYRLLLDIKKTPKISGKIKWENILNNNLHWKNIYKKPMETTNDNKLKMLQFKILHRKIATNKFLGMIGIKDTQLCTFCKKHIETIEHLFFDCIYTKSILIFVKSRINFNTLLKFPEDQASILLGNEVENLAMNYIIMVIKYFIYKCKYNETPPDIRAFQNFFKYKINIEKSSYTTKKQKLRFTEIWKDLNPTILFA